MTISYINTNGMAQIATALGQFHKLGRDHFTTAMLNAWANEAELSFENGNGMYFEIKSWDSATGRTEVVSITSDGYDIEVHQAYRAAFLAASQSTTSGGFVLTGPEHSSLSDSDLIAAALPALAEYNAASYAIGEDGATEAEILIGDWL